MITELNERSRAVFKNIVDTYLETGSPVGSRTISKLSGLGLSAASIRNVMADLEEAGLLHAPHISAGRMPTETGLRLYIDGLMEVGALTQEERKAIEAECNVKGLSSGEMVDKASTVLSSLSSCASLVIAPKADEAVRQIQFVALGPGKILVVMVMGSGLVENRIMEVEGKIPAHALEQASNYLNARLAAGGGSRTIEDTRGRIAQEIKDNQAQIDALTRDLVERGLALPQHSKSGHIIVRGQSRLLEDITALADLERARALLSYLEEQKEMLGLLDSVGAAEGVQIFIGTENKIFNQSGWSLILSPYRNAEEQIIGAVGVVGPTRLDYDRIIPMVDYTSKVISKLVDRL